MESIIDLIYEYVQESQLIQNGREDSQKVVEQIVGNIMNQKQLLPEEVADQLYSLVLTAEKAGFRSGVIIGAKLVNELQLNKKI